VQNLSIQQRAYKKLLKNVRKPKNVSDKDYLFFVRLGKRILAKKKKKRFGKRRVTKTIFSLLGLEREEIGKINNFLPLYPYIYMFI
jgi:hypothetical protein